ncbi:motility associated factor glycosyltransferase family protein [Campylobacter sp. 2018MI35]|uniref:motility associated factor glycosyltransferase family protein n=1 Tax=Campylobacter sp. 2018MI34 TaxID=2800582 RepID=UPI0019031235|nr:motility associated factor glycosyltransferase family protein [Campylobacter sp. 2018MI34]MBK1991597.1 motility associated factor glycosyltransferase family protein [Campylobacter sp. 2018MI34]
MEIFYKNINALSNIVLKEKLLKLKENTHFENGFYILQGKDNLDINIHSKMGGGIYQNPLEELKEKLELYNHKYYLYPVLYFYGFGNGILYKILLQNKNHQKIVIFEPNIPLLFVLFNSIDFSKELANLIILNPYEENFFGDLLLLSQAEPYFKFLRVYFLDIHSKFYAKNHQENILKINKKFTELIKDIFMKQGNDPEDVLIGIRHNLQHLAPMLTNSSLLDLIKARKNKMQNAIIVSTGPSLIKQLPLLKQYTSKASIFCADSSYIILANYGIKPDYVLSTERVIETSKFFDNDFKEFDQGILFILSTLTHPQTLKHIQNANRKYILTPKDMFFRNFKFKQILGLGQGHSVAHMCYDLALILNHKNIILIGQDLAYDKEGNSHPKEYLYGANDEQDPNDIKYELQTTAYGGKGLVYTQEIWNIFRTTFEKNIAQNPHIKVYNCTEGGARIEGSIEQSFKSICANLLNDEKNFKEIPIPSIAKQNEYLLKAYAKIKSLIKQCNDFINYFDKELKLLSNDFLNLKLEYNENLYSKLIKNIDEIKLKIDEVRNNHSSIYMAFYPTINQFEFNLAKIFVLNPSNKEELLAKKNLWIEDHLYLFTLIFSQIEIFKNLLEQNINNLKNELIARNLEKRIIKFDKD